MAVIRVTTPHPEVRLGSRNGVEDIPTPKWLAAVLLLVPIPIVLVARNGVEVTPADFLGPILLVGALLGPRRQYGRQSTPSVRAAVTFLWLTVVLGLLAMVAGTLSDNHLVGAGEQLGSLAFMMRPFVFFLAGATLVVRYRIALRSLVLPLGLSSSFSCLVVFAGLLASGGENYQYGSVEYGGSMLYGEHLGGSYLGLPLFGRFGVNSLAETYMVYCALSLAALVHLWEANGARHRFGGTPIRSIFLAAGVMAGARLVWTSESRQAMVGVSIIAGLTCVGYLCVRVLGLRHVTVLALASTSVAALVVYGFTILQLEHGAPRADDFSTGRISIAQSGWSETLAHPFGGRGFSNSSGANEAFNAHNIVLNAAYRMGIVGTLAYLGLLMHASLPSLRRLRHGSVWKDVLIIDVTWIVLVAVIGLVSNSLDIVTASGPVLFLVAAYSYVAPGEHSTESDDGRMA